MTKDNLEPISPAEAKEMYLDARKREVSQSTLDGYHYRLKHFIRWCKEVEGIENMNSLSGRDLQRYKTWRRDDGDLKPISLEGQLDALRIFIRWCGSIDAVEPDLHEKFEAVMPTLDKTDEQAESILETERAEELIESQGNATVKQFRMWVRENDTLDANENTAIESVLDDLLNEAPSDWRVKGEFGEWLEHRIEDARTTNVEIPVAGRTNSEMVQIRREKPGTETKEIEIPVAGRHNEETTTVEKEVPVTNGMEKIEEWQAKEIEMKAEIEQDRINRRKEARKHQMNNGPYTLDDEEVDEDLDIPAGGRSNWEKRKEGDDR